MSEHHEQLVSRPREEIGLMVKDPIAIATREFPMYSDSIAIDSTIPCAAFCLKEAEAGNSPLAQALASQQTDFDFRLVEPTGVLGRVMNCETFP
jgi:hypothetical protein